MIGRFLGAISLSKFKNKKLKYLGMVAIPVVAFIFIALITDLETAMIYGTFLLINLAAFFFGKSLPNRTLYLFAIVNMVLLAVALTISGAIALWSIIAIGLFNSIMWSNIFTLAIAGLGKYTSQGSSLLVMMILGGALVPLLQGVAADSYGVHLSFIVPVFCYIYIAFYGINGYKPSKMMSQ